MTGESKPHPLVVAFEAERKGGLGGVIARLEVFDTKRDPRIGHFLVTLIERYRPWDTPKARQVHQRAFELLAKHADADVLDRLVKLADWAPENTGLVVTTRWFDAEVRKTIAALGRRVPKLDPDAIGLPAIKPAPKRPKDRRSALYDAVYAEPDDDTPRAVLSDFLLHEGDPHGELIALQLAPKTPASDKRARALLRKEGARFVDPLVWRALMPRTVVFERGFPASGHVSPRSAADFDRAIGAEAWATLHTLTLRSFAGFNTTAEDTSKMLAFLTHPAMRHLKRVAEIGRSELVAIVHHGKPLPWRELTVRKRTYDGTAEAFAAARERLPEIFPKLERFEAK